LSDPQQDTNLLDESHSKGDEELQMHMITSVKNSKIFSPTLTLNSLSNLEPFNKKGDSVPGKLQGTNYHIGAKSKDETGNTTSSFRSS
jgi:hypothetical protein